MDMSMASSVSPTTSTKMVMTSTLSSTTATALEPTTTARMGGMDMSSTCKISMLWNWYTIDACFLSRTWHITSSGMFAGSCIGVILLVMSLEFLRRLQREHDRHVRWQMMGKQQGRAALARIREEDGNARIVKEDQTRVGERERESLTSGNEPSRMRNAALMRPRLLQQLLRAGLHMIQFAVAYFIMLLAMYYNGYILICIFIGAFLGAFLFSWDQLTKPEEAREAEVTSCCG